MSKFCKWVNGELSFKVNIVLNKQHIINIINNMLNNGILINNKTQIMKEVYSILDNRNEIKVFKINPIANQIFDKYFTDYK